MPEAGSRSRTIAPRASHRLLVVAALVALPTFASTGQDQPPVFPSRVELTTVDAVVVDSHGQPVPGLTREDFVVLEGGVPQEIVAFEGIVQPGAPGSVAVLTPSTPPPPARVATNLAPPPEGASFLIVADDIHLSARGAVEARSAIERFLGESVRDGDRVAVLSTRTGSGWTGTLMEDREDLRAFVSRLQSRARDVGPQLMTEYEALRIAEYNDTVDTRSGRRALLAAEAMLRGSWRLHGDRAGGRRGPALPGPARAPGVARRDPGGHREARPRARSQGRAVPDRGLPPRRGRRSCPPGREGRGARERGRVLRGRARRGRLAAVGLRRRSERRAAQPVAHVSGPGDEDHGDDDAGGPGTSDDRAVHRCRVDGRGDRGPDPPWHERPGSRAGAHLRRVAKLLSPRLSPDEPGARRPSTGRSRSRSPARG